MTIPVAQGSHRIEYRYENKPIHYALWLSGVTLITLIGFFTLCLFQQEQAADFATLVKLFYPMKNLVV